MRLSLVIGKLSCLVALPATLGLIKKQWGIETSQRFIFTLRLFPSWQHATYCFLRLGDNVWKLACNTTLLVGALLGPRVLLKAAKIASLSTVRQRHCNCPEMKAAMKTQGVPYGRVYWRYMGGKGQADVNTERIWQIALVKWVSHVR